MKGLPRSLRHAQDNNASEAHESMLHSLAMIAASSVTALTDNSGGSTADGTLDAIGNMTKAAVGTNDAAQKAALEAAFVTVKNALMEVIDQTQAINAVVPALGGALVNSIGGTASDKTIAAITENLTGVGSSMANAVGARAIVTNITARMTQLRYHVNKIAVACGQGQLVDELAVASPSTSLTFAALATDTGTATDGSDATDAHAVVIFTDANTILGLISDNIKEFATKLNACRSATGGVMGVVDTSP